MVTDTATEQKIKKFQYWVPVAREEHYLFPTEIAELLRLYHDRSNKPARVFVSAWCSYYEKQNSIRPTYFLTKNGMRRCYSVNVYGKLLKECSHREQKYSFEVNGKHYDAVRKIKDEINV